MEKKITERPLQVWLRAHSHSIMWLAQQTGVSYMSAWSWCRGLTMPTSLNAKKLAKLTGLTLDELID
jgi:hypothetical protein